MKNYSRPFRPASPETDQPVDSAEHVCPSKWTESEVFMSLIKREAAAQNVHVKKETLSTSSHFEPLGETEAQLNFLNMIALGGTIDNADHTVDGVDAASAADEAEPSSSVEPAPALLSRRSATVNRSTKKTVPRVPASCSHPDITRHLRNTEMGQGGVEILCPPTRTARRKLGFQTVHRPLGRLRLIPRTFTGLHRT